MGGKKGRQFQVVRDTLRPYIVKKAYYITTHTRLNTSIYLRQISSYIINTRSSRRRPAVWVFRSYQSDGTWHHNSSWGW